MVAKSADQLTSVHEALVRLLARMPEPRLLALICPLIELEPSAIVDLRQQLGSVNLPALYGTARSAYADLVLELRTHGGSHIRVVILEVQLSIDRKKLLVWPLLQAGLARPSAIETRLLLLTPTPELRTRIQRRVLDRLPMVLSKPLFIGPDQIPFIHDYTQARSRPHETILGAAFHSREPNSPGRQPSDKKAALRAAFVALETFDPITALQFQAIIMSIAPPHLVSSALTELRERGEITESRYEQFSEVERGGHSFHRGQEEGLHQGLLQGQRKMLITLIEARFGPLDAAQLERLGHASSAELERLGVRLHAASSVESLLS